MHIGIFSYYYLPVINGVTLSIADWKKYAQKDRVSFTVCVPNLGRVQKDPDVFSYPAVSLWKRFGITVPFFPESAIEQVLREQKVDVLHAHHPFYIGKLALRANRQLYLPLVFTYHTRYSDYLAQYFPVIKPIASILINRSVVRFMNQCDAITVASATLQKELRSFGVRTPIFLVPPGVDTKKYGNGNRSKGRKRLGLKSGDTALLYVGRFAREKNIYFLLQSFLLIQRHIANTKLILAGNGLEEDRLRTWCKIHGIKEKVIFAIHENPETIADVYKAGDIFVYGSQTETFGRVLVEAMSAGVPVVALSGPSIVDILKNPKHGVIVEKKSPQVYADAVISLIKNPLQRENFAKAAKAEAIREYDSTVSWNKLKRVYKSLL